LFGLHSLFFLGFGFRFGFSGGLFFMPVQLLKRKGRMKPATTSHFFDRLRVALLKIA